MTKDKIDFLPEPLPQEALLLGPKSWDRPDRLPAAGCRWFGDPEAALEWCRSGAIGTADQASSRLVLLHQDAFAGAGGVDRLEGWLQELHRMDPSSLPVLIHGGIPAGALVRFFRAGLFDALALPIGSREWFNVLIRAEKRLERRSQSRLVLEANVQTQDLLRRMRRRIETETDRTAGDLLEAQESLETVNRQLTDAMAEISLLYRFGRELSQARNWDEVLRRILKELAEFVGAGGAALVLKSAPGGRFSPRQTWQWEEKSWDKVLVNLHDQVDAAVAESIMAPGVFRIDAGAGGLPDQGRRIIALPLEHQDLRLGYLLLLFATPERRRLVAGRNLPFLQAVQVVLAEEVAGAQMLDRIRDIGTFNARVLETVSSGIWVLDEQGRTVFCNRAGQELLTGRPSRQAASLDFFYQIGRGDIGKDLKPEDEVPELIMDACLGLPAETGLVLAALRNAPGGTYRGPGNITSRPGEVIPVLVQTSFMEGQARNQTWLVVVAEDQREARQLEQERMRVGQLQGLVEMSATLAHEIRNPLMGLSAQAELLADRLPEDDPRIKYIDVITREVDRINQTITRMLNFVRPYEPTLAAADLEVIDRDCLELCRERALDKGVELVAGDPRDPGAARDFRLDEVQIKQVILNLLINAIDAVPVGGRVQVRLSYSDELGLPDRRRGGSVLGSGVVIEVLDDGPGFADGDLARIFRPFYTTKSSGTGLGLSLCHKIVLAHGGDISAARVEESTVFRVVLPREAGLPSAAQARTEEA